MNKLRLYRRRYFLQFEAAIAVSVTGLFALWYLHMGGSSDVERILAGNGANIYRAIATMATTLLGFGVAATSIVFGLSSHDRLELLRNSPHFGQLWKTLFQTIKFLACLGIAGLAGLIIDRDRPHRFVDLVPYVRIAFVLFLALSIVRVYRSIWILEQMVKSATWKS